MSNVKLKLKHNGFKFSNNDIEILTIAVQNDISMKWKFGEYNYNTDDGNLIGHHYHFTENKLHLASVSLVVQHANILVLQGDIEISSDRTLKKNIENVGDPLEKINQINGVKFDWKKSGATSYGIIAQELEQVEPDAVSGGGDTSLTVNYNSVIALLVESVKELNSKCDKVTDKYAELNGKYAELNGKYTELNGKYNDITQNYQDVTQNYQDDTQKYGHLIKNQKNITTKQDELETKYSELMEIFD